MHMIMDSGAKKGKRKTEEKLAETIREDLRIQELTWEDALDAAEDRDG